MTKIKINSTIKNLIAGLKMFPRIKQLKFNPTIKNLISGLKFNPTIKYLNLELNSTRLKN